MVRQLIIHNVDLTNKNMQAFAKMVRAAEGTPGDKGYTTIVGGSHFTDFSKHPNKLIKLVISGKTVYSTAAGAYQFIRATWARLQKKLNLPDFSPASQDRAFAELLAELGIDDDIIAGNIELAITIASSTWASLAGSKAGQHPKNMKWLVAQYVAAGGTIATKQQVA